MLGYQNRCAGKSNTLLVRLIPTRVILCINLLDQPKWKSRFRYLPADAQRRKVQELWTAFRSTYAIEFPRGLPDMIGNARFVQFDGEGTPYVVLPRKVKLVWFLPGGTLRARRDTIDGVLAWLSWLLVPEPLLRRLARRLINSVSFIFMFFALLVGLLFGFAYVSDGIDWLKGRMHSQTQSLL